MDSRVFFIFIILLSIQETHNNLTDEELLRQFQSDRDNYWLGILLPRYTLLLFGVALKYLKDKEEAQDAVQQVFLKTLTQLPAEEIKNFKGWLYILMRNHCLQLLRDKKHFSVNMPQEQQAEISDDNENEWLNYSSSQINEAFDELVQEQRKSIKMFYLEKKSYKQITEQTGYSFMQVKSFIQNGKRKLKIILMRKAGKHNG
jgi:RNA polymerase sigma factor (sigma-70 family)